MNNLTTNNINLIDKDQYSYTSEGEVKQEISNFRFRVVFKECVGLNRFLHFPIYAYWMGNLREISVMPVAEGIVRDFRSGEYGLVTNETETIILGTPDALDLIEGRVWVTSIFGKDESVMNLRYDWLKVNEDGSKERLAHGFMGTTWVKITGHGKVKVEPYPEYLSQLMWRMYDSSKSEEELNRIEELPTQLGDIDAGINHYQYIGNPRRAPLITWVDYHTSNDDSNLVGNVYYATYYKLMSKVVDKILYHALPDYFSQSGELFCTRMKVGHLREAMPFDHLIAEVRVITVSDKVVELYIEYFNQKNGEREKLAYGNYSGAWTSGVHGGENLKDSLGAMPLELTRFLLQKTETVAA